MTPREAAIELMHQSGEENIQQFHIMVGEIERLIVEAVRAEREACAKIAEARYAEPGWCGDYKNAAITIANGIRARG